MPAVSVLIASHRPHLLPYALDSIWRQNGIAQSDIQVLVNYCQDPRNFHTAWNSLASIATGRYLCILGDDDTLNPPYLASLVEALDDTKADIGYSNTQGAHRYANGQITLGPIYRPPPHITLDTMRDGNKIWQTSLVRTAAWLAVGGYDMSIEYVHDYDFWVRVLKAGGRTTYVNLTGWTHYTHDGHRVTTSINRERAFQQFYTKHPDLKPSASS